MKKRFAAFGILSVLCVTMLTGCGEVSMYGSCNFYNGAYDYFYSLKNDQSPEPIYVVNSGVSPVPVGGESATPLKGVTIDPGATWGAFSNGESFSSQTYVVQTHPVSDPSNVSTNYVVASC